MIKILLSLLFISSLAFATSPKAVGCDLSQTGNVELNLGSKNFKKADYKAIVKTGKNFKAIFIGSVISVDGAVVKITDITSDKRVKGKPRTGIITVSLDSDSKIQTLDIPYTYNKGHFSAKGVQKSGKSISFTIEIEAVLCHAK